VYADPMLIMLLYFHLSLYFGQIVSILILNFSLKFVSDTKLHSVASKRYSFIDHPAARRRRCRLQKQVRWFMPRSIKPLSESTKKR